MFRLISFAVRRIKGSGSPSIVLPHLHRSAQGLSVNAFLRAGGCRPSVATSFGPPYALLRGVRTGICSMYSSWTPSTFRLSLQQIELYCVGGRQHIVSATSPGAPAREAPTPARLVIQVGMEPTASRRQSSSAKWQQLWLRTSYSSTRHSCSSHWMSLSTSPSDVAVLPMGMDSLYEWPSQFRGLQENTPVSSWNIGLAWSLYDHSQP
mmetsp:Transcript_30604/g.90795  ORF Transcript_30604/g.90795 Transcript_30604/m.90795 type:complete len:208 (-) Transcript_30604:270-893(-)